MMAWIICQSLFVYVLALNVCVDGYIVIIDLIQN